MEAIGGGHHRRQRASQSRSMNYLCRGNCVGKQEQGDINGIVAHQTHYATYNHTRGSMLLGQQHPIGTEWLCQECEQSFLTLKTMLRLLIPFNAANANGRMSCHGQSLTKSATNARRGLAVNSITTAVKISTGGKQWQRHERRCSSPHAARYPICG